MEETTVKKNNHGPNVRRWREWRNINQDVLAEKIGVSQATLSLYEKKEKLEPEILDKENTTSKDFDKFVQASKNDKMVSNYRSTFGASDVWGSPFAVRTSICLGGKRCAPHSLRKANAGTLAASSTA